MCKKISGAYHHANPYVYSRKCTLNISPLHICKNTAEKYVPDCKWIFPAIAQVKNTKNGSDDKGANPVQSQDRHQCPSKEQLLL